MATLQTTTQQQQQPQDQHYQSLLNQVSQDLMLALSSSSVAHNNAPQMP
jgi:hypothetical protein